MKVSCCTTKDLEHDVRCLPGMALLLEVVEAQQLLQVWPAAESRQQLAMFHLDHSDHI